ncbi:MAG: NAD(P)H-hydrate dehydratase [Planctomycetaceae bacterium]
MHRITTPPEAPVRSVTGHKGTFGRVLIIAGSRGMSGAAALAGCGALRGGAGLVTVAMAESIVSIVATIEPGLLTWPLVEDAEGRIDAVNGEAIVQRARTMDAVAIGPGLGQSAGLKEIVRRLLFDTSVPLVIDAEGLNLLIGQTDWLRQRAGTCVITPHPGEFARLTGEFPSDDVDRRVKMATDFARETGVTVVLKGAGTIVAAEDEWSQNETGNSGMATGGSGDVLTGLIAALLAQGMSPMSGARLGVWLHGRAGDLAAAELSEPGLIASDLPRYLGRAWLSMRKL